MKNKIEPIVGKSSLWYKVDGPWPSPESEKIKQAAIDKFDELVNSGEHNYLALVASSHWAAEGYWIEFKEPNLGILVGGVMKVHNPTKGGTE